MELRWRGLRRAFGEFLAVPTMVVAGLLMLLGLCLVADGLSVSWLSGVRMAMQRLVFSDSQATATLLAQLASSIVTATSITFPVLLLAVQQTAASMTAVVYGQFLRRRINQVYFGYSVGLTIFSFVLLATVDNGFNPVISATVALLLVIVAFYFLIVLIYATITQARPEAVVHSVRDHGLRARRHQHDLLDRTQRSARGVDAPQQSVRAAGSGFVSYIDVASIQRAAHGSDGIEVEIRVRIGQRVNIGELIARVIARDAQQRKTVADSVAAAVALERRRDLAEDPSYAVDALLNIAWTCVSSSKQNPYVGLLAAYGLRDLLDHWVRDPSVDGDRPASRIAAARDQAPSVTVVYPDTLLRHTLNALVELSTVASEGLQPAAFAVALGTASDMLPLLDTSHQAHVVDGVRRMLTCLGDAVLTVELQERLYELATALRSIGHPAAAGEVDHALQQMVDKLGQASSRGNRLGS